MAVQKLGGIAIGDRVVLQEIIELLIALLLGSGRHQQNLKRQVAQSVIGHNDELGFPFQTCQGIAQQLLV